MPYGYYPYVQGSGNGANFNGQAPMHPPGYGGRHDQQYQTPTPHPQAPYQSSAVQYSHPAQHSQHQPYLPTPIANANQSLQPLQDPLQFYHPSQAPYGISPGQGYSTYSGQPQSQQQTLHTVSPQFHGQTLRQAPSPQWSQYPSPVQSNDTSSSMRSAQYLQQHPAQQQQQQQQQQQRQHPHPRQRPPSNTGYPSPHPQPSPREIQYPPSGTLSPSLHSLTDQSIQQSRRPTSARPPLPPQQHRPADGRAQPGAAGSHPVNQPLNQPQQELRPPSRPNSTAFQKPNIISQPSPQQPLSGPPLSSTLPDTIDPSKLQRRVAHVEIPMQRVSAKFDQSTTARSPKRRKSNDGEAVPIYENEQLPQRQHSSKLPKKTDMSSMATSESTTPQLPSLPALANIDYQAVLLGLSDEYIKAAYSMSAGLAVSGVDESDLDQYHSLLSTGMGCLDAVLKNYHISDPRKHARVRLRLASLLYEETDNDVEAEEVLIKGLSVCDRARLLDLKYAMHHLMARIWFKGGKSKTAIKAVEKNIAEVEKLDLLHWLYAFRFLRVSLSLRIGNTNVETAAIVKQLSAISATAAQHRHVAIQYVASTIEALVYLRSRTPESIDLAQRALTSGRSHQLSPELNQLPQVKLLVHCIDLGCNLARFRHDQVTAKLETMQANMDALAQDRAWNEDGSWTIPFSVSGSCPLDIETDSVGVFRRLAHNEYGLTLRWLTKSQTFTLGFLLSGLACIHKNATHEQKAESFLQEGYKLAKTALEPVQQSVAAASMREAHQTLTRILIRLYVVFATCGRADWSRSLKGIENIRHDLRDLEGPPDEHVLSLTSYLEAVARHGMGELQHALKLYRSPELKLHLNGEPKSMSSTAHPLKVLAALNSIPILRFNGNGPEAEMLLYNLQSHCLPNSNSNGNEYGNKAVESVFYILKATEPNDGSTENPIIKTKTFLQSAVSAAKSAVNNQLLCVVMNVMTDAFFHNIVGDQAEKSARAGRALAKKSKDPLWTAVSDGMYMDTLERCGKKEEAEQARHEAREALQRIPASLKAALMNE